MTDQDTADMLELTIMRVSKPVLFTLTAVNIAEEQERTKEMGAFIVVIFILLMLGLIRRRNLRRARVRASVRVRIPR